MHHDGITCVNKNAKRKGSGPLWQPSWPVCISWTVLLHSPDPWYLFSFRFKSCLLHVACRSTLPCISTHFLFSIVTS